MSIKPFEELTIQDNFIFQKVMRNKRICKQTIERLLDIDIKDIEYLEEEKTIDVRLDSKSVRLDVFVNDDKGTIFNIEMQTSKDMKELVKRARYYQSAIDIDSLEKGQHYSELNDVYVIFICTFEVYPDKLHKYDFKNVCLQNTRRHLNDGSHKIFLSTKGELDDVSKELKYFLDYIDGKEPEDSLMCEIDSEVHTIKQCDEWRRDYMTLAFEMENKLKEGIEIGREEGREEGRTEGKVEAVIGMLKEKLSVEMISRITKLTVEQITEIGKMNALL